MKSMQSQDVYPDKYFHLGQISRACLHADLKEYPQQTQSLAVPHEWHFLPKTSRRAH